MSSNLSATEKDAARGCMNPSDNSTKNRCCDSKQSREAGENVESSFSAMNELLSLLGHELRTPLAGTMGMLELVLAGELDADQRGALELANASARAMLRLVEDLHDLARMEAGRLQPKKTPFEVEAWKRNVEQGFAGAPAVEFFLAIDPQVPQILIGDGDRIAHLVLNLIDLHLKYSRSKRVLLNLTLESEGGDRFLLGTISEAEAALEDRERVALLQSCGAGRLVPMAEFRRVGLKQAVVWNLAVSLGGALWPDFESEEEPVRALAVPVDLPSLPAGGRDGGVALQVCEEMPRMKRDLSAVHILLVEDDDAIRKLVELFLQQRGWQVTAVSDGLQALDSFQKNRFDLVLMDIRMPRLDGLEATRRIRRREQALGIEPLPIIGMTAHAAVQDRSLCLQAGMNDHLSKPIASNRLYAIIERCLASDK